MITPQKIIDKARREGHCKISQHCHLWLTSEAQKHLKIDTNTEFFLITESQGFQDPVPVASAKNKTLIKCCEARNGKK